MFIFIYKTKKQPKDQGQDFETRVMLWDVSRPRLKSWEPPLRARLPQSICAISSVHEVPVREVSEDHSYLTQFTTSKQQESSADADKPARLKRMQKLLQFDVFRFISPNSISPNCQCIASRGMFSQALGLYCYSQFEIRCLPIIKFLV